MNTIHTFGDSFTFGHGCRPDGPINEYYYNYKSYSDDVWPNLLGQMLNVEVKNLGKCGASNDFIIDSIIYNFEKIQQNDVVIIGKTFYQRFDITNLNSNTFEIYCSLLELCLDVYFEMNRSNNDFDNTAKKNAIILNDNLIDKIVKSDFFQDKFE